jgi:hypothetical protein
VGHRGQRVSRRACCAAGTGRRWLITSSEHPSPYGLTSVRSREMLMLAAPRTDMGGELRPCKRAHCLVSLSLGLIGLCGVQDWSKLSKITPLSWHWQCWERDTASTVVVLLGSDGTGQATGRPCRLVHMSSADWMCLVSNNTFGSRIVPKYQGLF